MKIGMFTDSYKPYTSGVVTSISTFKEELQQMGHEIYIFAPSYPNYEDDEAGVFRYKAMPSPTNKDFSVAIPVYPGMNTLLKKLDLDIIHAHSPFNLGLVGMHFANRLGIPLIFTYHTMYDQYVHYVPVGQELVKDVAIKFCTNFCNQCDHVVVPGTDVKRILERNRVKTPVSVIPTGVPLHRFQGQKEDWLRNNYNIPKDNKILLFVGRLAKEKNIPFLIKAFKKIQESMPDTTLVLTAGGPLEEELKELAAGELGLVLDKDIIFTGAQPVDTLVDIYYSADLFVFSSLSETQGLVLIEAMAAGVPVVAVQASGVQDMIDHGVDGLLTELDINDFARSVSDVLSDEKTHNYFKKNALLKADKMSSGSMARRMEEVYLELQANSPNRRKGIHEFLSNLVP